MQTMNREQIAMAVNAGLELLSNKSEVAIPMRLFDSVSLLRLLLSGIARGEIALGSPETPQPLPIEPEPESEGDEND